jgi:fatty-acyl-CoA synthase
VSGSPDPLWGEVVTAFVVAGDREPSLDDIRHHLDGRLAKYKWPRLLCVGPALPRGATGKLQRQALNTLLTQYPTQQVGDSPVTTPKEKP